MVHEASIQSLFMLSHQQLLTTHRPSEKKHHSPHNPRSPSARLHDRAIEADLDSTDRYSTAPLQTWLQFETTTARLSKPSSFVEPPPFEQQAKCRSFPVSYVTNVIRRHQAESTRISTACRRPHKTWSTSALDHFNRLCSCLPLRPLFAHHP